MGCRPHGVGRRRRPGRTPVAALQGPRLGRHGAAAAGARLLCPQSAHQPGIAATADGLRAGAVSARPSVEHPLPVAAGARRHGRGHHRAPPLLAAPRHPDRRAARGLLPRPGRRRRLPQPRHNPGRGPPPGAPLRSRGLVVAGALSYAVVFRGVAARFLQHPGGPARGGRRGGAAAAAQVRGRRAPAAGRRRAPRDGGPRRAAAAAVSVQRGPLPRRRHVCALCRHAPLWRLGARVARRAGARVPRVLPPADRRRAVPPLRALLRRVDARPHGPPRRAAGRPRAAVHGALFRRHCRHLGARVPRRRPRLGRLPPPCPRPLRPRRC